MLCLTLVLVLLTTVLLERALFSQMVVWFDLGLLGLFAIGCTSGSDKTSGGGVGDVGLTLVLGETKTGGSERVVGLWGMPHVCLGGFLFFIIGICSGSGYSSMGMRAKGLSADAGSQSLSLSFKAGTWVN